ncbi:hypothetical protein BD311DRAFT_471836 [Dichomitus squalens]|uniref:Uncharacterized protein n=1 Tax=Dichomitus squalens TaxID=114155 RepID=A0A4Q9N1G0_9APHY|nr:hypothetical protein BD311DRAFT_471836 [Dichomitus squalens]
MAPIRRSFQQITMPTRSLILHFLLSSVSSCAALLNHTIDDELGDDTTGLLPAYSPQGGWNQGSQCLTCAARLDASLTFDRTWHDSTYHPGDPERVITVGFTGVAVYVYHIVPNQAGSDVTTFTNLSFFLHNESVGQFVHEVDETSNYAYAYNVLVYANTTLPDAEHFLDIRASGPNSSLLLFDYVVYTANMTETTQDASSTSTDIAHPATSHSLDTPTMGSVMCCTGASLAASPGTSVTTPLLGTLLGIAVALLLSLTTFIFLRRRSRKRRQVFAIRQEPRRVEATTVHPVLETGCTSSPHLRELPVVLGIQAQLRAVDGRPSERTSVVDVYADASGDSAGDPRETGSFENELQAIREEVGRLREAVDGVERPPPYETVTR